MNNNLITFLSKYQSLTKEEVKIIEQQDLLRECKSGTILLKEGQISKECFLVLKGCVRSYYIIDGDENTTNIYTEMKPITPISFAKQLPSEYYLECVEDSVLSVGTPEKTNQFLMKYPQFVTLMTTIANDISANQQEEFDDFKNLSPEKRYKELLKKRPELVNRVSQSQLASFLGVKPQSLSRIRKRIFDKK